MKTRVEILSVEENSGVSMKTGTAKPWSIRKAHAVLHLVDGKEVGIIQIPRDMERSPAPGMYDAEFGIGVDFKTREVHGRLVGLIPVSSGPDAYFTGSDKSAPAAKKAV